MAIMARLTIFVKFRILGKPSVATAFVGGSKILMVKVEIYSFSIYLFKKDLLSLSSG